MHHIQFQKSAIDPSGAISNGWNLIKPNYAMYLGIVLLTWVLIACIPCLNVLLLGPISGGVYYVLLRDMRGEPVNFGMMFKGFEKFGTLLAIGVLQSLPGIIWQIVDTTANVSTRIWSSSGSSSQTSEAEVLLIGGLAAVYVVFAIVFAVLSIVWAISFAFAIPLAAEHDIGPIEALKLSARAGWSNVGGIIVTAILLMLIAIVGFLALCIGIFFVLPLFFATWAFVYRQVFPSNEPMFPSGPPPPTAYGGSYGREM
ncbi:MAG: hypothetical protein H0V76_02085 [Blastocatellia bacterium]|nr:hypothetical protein [Blastocatellia bacterium]